MTKYVEWVEPFWNEYPDVPVILRLTVEDAIIVQKASLEKSGNKTFKYESDEDALDDFVVIHWGNIVEG